MQTKQIPANACRFVAEVEFGDNGDGAKTSPVKFVARSSDPVAVNGWGNVVHDFAGMKAKSRLSLDYEHDSTQIVGYVNQFDSSNGQLEVSGAIVPKSQWTIANEIIENARAGVPYEASIDFRGAMRIETVPAGRTAQANGRTYSGPVDIVREWNLKALAVCQCGRDAATSVQLLSNDSDTVTAEVIEMDEQATAVVEEVKPVEATEELNTSAEAAAEVAGAVEVPAVEEIEEHAIPVPVEAAAMSDGEKFLKTFGDKGGVWFAQGKTFEEAQQLHFADIVAERDQLKKDNDELKQKLSVTRGEAEPLSASIEKPAATKAAEKAAAYQGKLSEPLARFAASLTKE